MQAYLWLVHPCSEEQWGGAGVALQRCTSYSGDRGCGAKVVATRDWFVRSVAMLTFAC